MCQRTTFSVVFFCKRTKVNKKGQSPYLCPDFRNQYRERDEAARNENGTIYIGIIGHFRTGHQ